MQKENKEIVKTATEILRILWGKGFLRVPRKISDVVVEFSKIGYNFSLTNIDKTLQRAQYLTRKGKRGAYKYVQRYPFMKEGLQVRSKES